MADYSHFANDTNSIYIDTIYAGSGPVSYKYPLYSVEMFNDKLYCGFHNLICEFNKDLCKLNSHKLSFNPEIIKKINNEKLFICNYLGNYLCVDKDFKILKSGKLYKPPSGPNNDSLFILNCFILPNEYLAISFIGSRYGSALVVYDKNFNMKNKKYDKGNSTLENSVQLISNPYKILSYKNKNGSFLEYNIHINSNNVYITSKLYDLNTDSIGCMIESVNCNNIIVTSFDTNRNKIMQILDLSYNEISRNSLNIYPTYITTCRLDNYILFKSYYDYLILDKNNNVKVQNKIKSSTFNNVKYILREKGKFILCSVNSKLKLLEFEYKYIPKSEVFKNLSIKLNDKIYQGDKGWIKLNNKIYEIDSIYTKINGILKKI